VAAALEPGGRVVREQLSSYFFAEKWEGLAFVLVGIAAFALTAWLWRGAYRGMGVPLVLVGLIQLGVGGSVFLRSDRQEAALLEQLDRSPSELKALEVPRMEKVMANFRIYKVIELLVLALGVALTFAFSDRDFVYSAGIGCIAQGAFMLVLDLFAEHRGEAYLSAVRALS
jgi:hypothetical protein